MARSELLKFDSVPVMEDLRTVYGLCDLVDARKIVENVVTDGRIYPINGFGRGTKVNTSKIVTKVDDDDHLRVMADDEVVQVFISGVVRRYKPIARAGWLALGWRSSRWLAIRARALAMWVAMRGISRSRGPDG
ncbi:hypothetical protein SELMODRAFT_424087 [Selaginella moellendorffii]|uniref:Uncharacterized protein n=1 Tax=Selaginella moellendorffii TaxID=88036 RepID=D8SNR8_SELML|nr:hypothetical protein SELMODRAFT_424087 [Selaginella moellendorffii]